MNWPRRVAFLVSLVELALTVAFGGASNAATLTNGDFETGDLTGWTVFTSNNGALGGAGFPLVLVLDIKGDGVVSKSAAFKVGQRVFAGLDSTPEGGGMYQTVTLNAGSVTLTADIAVTYSSSRHARNLSGGLFELMLDDKVLDSHDVGAIGAGTTERSHLSGSASVPAGTHAIRLRITRPAVVKVGTPAPVQFIDNIGLTVPPSP